jgi:hypothetical protein
MDFIMDLPVTPGKNDAIMVLVDKLTKYVHLVPCRKKITSEDVARLFVQHIFQHHGTPKVLISDRDPRFTSDFWISFCKRLGMDKPRYSTAYHPQTDGQTERTNRVLEEVLRHFIDGRHANWEELLPLAAFAINNSRSSTTGETPYFLNHGSHPATPASLGVPEGKLPTLEVIFQDMESSLSRVKELLKSAQDRQKGTFPNGSRARGGNRPETLVRTPASTPRPSECGKGFSNMQNTIITFICSSPAGIFGGTGPSDAGFMCFAPVVDLFKAYYC